MRIVAIVQARMGSTRLPGKVLLPFGAGTALESVVRRVRAVHALEMVVVATSTDPADDAVAEECRRIDVDSFRGPVDDVLGRFHGAAMEFGAQAVVRITADCPLIDPGVTGAMVSAFPGAGVDYYSNTVQRTFPRGLDTEIVTSAALKRAFLEAKETFEREHVTPYFYRHPELFAIKAYLDPAGADRSGMRWTLDTSEDYAALSAIVNGFPKNAQPGYAEILDFLKGHPEIGEINANVRQKSLGE